MEVWNITFLPLLIIHQGAVPLSIYAIIIARLVMSQKMLSEKGLQKKKGFPLPHQQKPTLFHQLLFTNT